MAIPPVQCSIPIYTLFNLIIIHIVVCPLHLARFNGEKGKMPNRLIREWRVRENGLEESISGEG